MNDSPRKDNWAMDQRPQCAQMELYMADVIRYAVDQGWLTPTCSHLREIAKEAAAWGAENLRQEWPSVYHGYPIDRAGVVAWKNQQQAAAARLARLRDTAENSVSVYQTPYENAEPSTMER